MSDVKDKGAMMDEKMKAMREIMERHSMSAFVEGSLDDDEAILAIQSLYAKELGVVKEALNNIYQAAGLEPYKSYTLSMKDYNGVMKALTILENLMGEKQV